MRPLAVPVLFAIVVVTGGCVSSATPAVPPGSEPTVEPSDTATPDDPPMRVDWDGDFTLALPNGWTVGHCDGDAPLLCVSDGGRHVGSVELGQYDAPEGLADGDLDGLARHVDTFLSGMRDDRAAGCPDRSFSLLPPVAVQVGGHPGLRAGFRLVDGSGVEVERVVQYWTVHDSALAVVTAAATHEERGCLERLGEFEPDDLEVALPHLDGIVERSPLPRRAAAG